MHPCSKSPTGYIMHVWLRNTFIMSVLHGAVHVPDTPTEQRSLHLHSESIDQWAGDTTSSTYRFISWDHGVPAAFPSLPKALLNAATSVSWMFKKRGKKGAKSLPNCVVSHVFRVQPTSRCPNLSLTIQATGGGLRVEAGSCPRCWTRVPRRRRRRKKEAVLPPKASCLSWGDDREREAGARNTAAVDAPPKRAAHRSHVCHHKPRVDYCTERLYNSEVGCCTCNITRWVAWTFWFLYYYYYYYWRLVNLTQLTLNINLIRAPSRGFQVH